MTAITAPAPAVGVLVRLEAAARRLAVLAEEVTAEQTRRDELIVQARDEGHSWSTIGRAAGLSIARCVAIVAGG